jgi:flagellar basal body-associated protein FliL
MPNLNALKEKLTSLKAALVEKTDKIATLRSWREKNAAPDAAAKGPSPHSLGAIFREGATGTRLQVLAFYLFILVALVSAGSLMKKLADKMRSSDANEQLRKDYSHEFSEAARKAKEKNDILALGQFTANAYTSSKEEAKMMRLDLWIRVSDPETAATINAKNALFRDRTMGALHDLFTEKKSLLGEAGKAEAREKIRETLNASLQKGRIEEVFIQNLVIE